MEPPAHQNTHHSLFETLESIMQEQRYEELKWKEAPLYYHDEPVAIEEEKRQQAPLHAETTALLVVDVQPEYWSNCPSVRTDFPEFPAKINKK